MDQNEKREKNGTHRSKFPPEDPRHQDILDWCGDRWEPSRRWDVEATVNEVAEWVLNSAASIIRDPEEVRRDWES